MFRRIVGDVVGFRGKMGTNLVISLELLKRVWSSCVTLLLFHISPFSSSFWYAVLCPHIRLSRSW